MCVCRYFFPSNVASNMDKDDANDQTICHKEDFSAIMEVLINDTDSILF